MSFIQKYSLHKVAHILFVVLVFLYTFLTDAPHWLLLATLFLAWAPVAWEALKSLKGKKFGSEIFFFFAAVIAVLGHEELAMTVVLLVVLIAEYFEDIVKERTERAVESLLTLVPRTAYIEQNGKEIEVPIDTVTEGVLVIVKTGTSIPVDGTITTGEAEVNQSALTGESVPATKRIGDIVYAGTFLESGALTIKTETVGEHTMFGRIRRLMEDAEKRKAKIQVVADKVAYILTPLLALFIGGVWFVTGDIKMVITLLVFGSPIELALVTPLAILAGTVSAFRQGVIIKGGLALEQFAKVDTIVFDKTGTLTLGSPQVVGVTVIDRKHTEKDILQLAAIAEKRSGHILAASVLKKAEEEGVTVPNPDTYEYLSGHGVVATYKGKTLLLGSRHLIEDKEHGNISTAELPQCPHGDVTHSSFYLAHGDTLCGMLCVRDDIRSDARQIITHFKSEGIKNLVLLSGDKTEVAQSIAREIGITEAYGDVLPDAKLEKIRELQKQGRVVAMLGDGINDAPALKAADVGIAMGAMGMEPAIEASDIALMTNDLSKVLSVHELSRRVIRTIKQNIIIGLGFTHVLGIILALLQVLNPIQAAFFHALPDLLILMNTSRLIHVPKSSINAR